MGKRLQRHLGRVESLDVGQYTLRTASGQAAIRCWHCGEINDIPRGHRVLKGGLVSPVWSCPACPVIEFIELESYDEAVLE